MEGFTEILIIMGIGSIIGLVIGNLLWHKDHTRIKLQEKIIDHYKGLSEYLEDKLNERWAKQHATMMQNLDNTLKELEKAVNEWESKRLMATLSYNDTNMGMAPGLSASIDPDETSEGITYLLQFGDYENPTFTREEMIALHGKKVMVVNPDTRETLYTLKELRDITKSWKLVTQREAFERNQSLFVFYPGGRAVEKSTTMLRKMAEELPETPETCPKCGAKISGGATHPGEDMIPDARVFYICGASISLRNWGEENPHVLLKNCSSLEEVVEKYPVLLGRLVYVTIKDPIEFFEAGTDKKVKDV